MKTNSYKRKSIHTKEKLSSEKYFLIGFGSKLINIIQIYSSKDNNLLSKNHRKNQSVAHQKRRLRGCVTNKREKRRKNKKIIFYYINNKRAKPFSEKIFT